MYTPGDIAPKISRESARSLASLVSRHPLIDIAFERDGAIAGIVTFQGLSTSFRGRKATPAVVDRQPTRPSRGCSYARSRRKNSFAALSLLLVYRSRLLSTSRASITSISLGPDRTMRSASVRERSLYCSKVYHSLACVTRLIIKVSHILLCQ